MRPTDTLPTLTAVFPGNSAAAPELHFTDPAQTWQDGPHTRPVSLTASVNDAQVSAALLCPLPDGGGVLLADWAAPTALSLQVPAALMAAVRAALGLSGVSA